MDVWRLQHDTETTLRVYDGVMNTHEHYYFLLETHEITHKYKDVLQTRPRMYFGTEQEKATGSHLVQKWQHADFYYEFVLTCRRYKTDWDLYVCDFSCSSKDYVLCDGCNQIRENSSKEQPCPLCGHDAMLFKQIEVITNDSTRLNTMNKYTYERLNNFRETMSRIQGKQQVNVPKSVYDQIIAMIEKNHTRVVKDDQTVSRYRNVSRQDISNYMRELKLKKFYNDVTYIHAKLTGKSPFIIPSHIEKRIIEDFQSLLTLYNRYDKDGRRSFLNSHYLLCKLLKRYDITVNTHEFNYLKTRERVNWHDDLCNKMFTDLGWEIK